jgi:hypothetical protein
MRGEASQIESMIWDRVALLNVNTPFKVFVFPDSFTDNMIRSHAAKGGQCWGIASRIPTRTAISFEMMPNGYLRANRVKLVDNRNWTKNNLWTRNK